jgi:hypothetical protein
LLAWQNTGVPATQPAPAVSGWSASVNGSAGLKGGFGKAVTSLVTSLAPAPERNTAVSLDGSTLTVDATATPGAAAMVMATGKAMRRRRMLITLKRYSAVETWPFGQA